MSAPKVVVRAVASASDCLEVANLTAQAFPEEVRAQGISVRQYRELEHEELVSQPHYWPTIGLACDGNMVLGTVVLSFADEEDGGLTYWQYSRRVGCIPTLLTLAYDHVLEEPLQPQECLIDFIAVAPEARGHGVGAALMAWAEATGAALLAARAPAALAAAGGPCMSLWVAADNVTACRLYQRTGYTAVKRTDEGSCDCIMSRVFRWFLGHETWIKMVKALPAPPGLALVKPEPVTIPLVASSAGTLPEDSLVEVPLGEAWRPPGPPALPRPPSTKALPRPGSALGGGAEDETPSSMLLRIPAHGGLQGGSQTRLASAGGGLVAKASSALEGQALELVAVSTSQHSGSSELPISHPALTALLSSAGAEAAVLAPVPAPAAH
eukprot:scaffold4.g4974.t1